MAGGKQKIDLASELAADNTTAVNAMVGIAREDLMGAVAVMLREMAGRPAKTVKHMKALGDEVVKIVRNESELAPDTKDRRFQDITFKYNPIYRMGMQYYLAVQKGVKDWIADLELDEDDVALCSYVCPGKADYGTALRALLDTMARER